MASFADNGALSVFSENTQDISDSVFIPPRLATDFGLMSVIINLIVGVNMA